MQFCERHTGLAYCNELVGIEVRAHRLRRELRRGPHELARLIPVPEVVDQQFNAIAVGVLVVERGGRAVIRREQWFNSQAFQTRVRIQQIVDRHILEGHMLESGERMFDGVVFKNRRRDQPDAVIGPVVSDPDSLFDHVARHAHFYQTMLADLHLPVFTARLSEILYETWSQALVQFQPDERRLRVSKDVLISYLTGGLLSVLIWWLNSEMPYTSQHMARQYDRLAVAAFFHAIGKDALTVEFDE